MAKLATLFLTLILLLSFSFGQIYASRPNAAFHGGSSLHRGIAGKKLELDEESCQGKEECLMRRTLEAHLDYIYTQNHKP